jgi:hypothetical protein
MTDPLLAPLRALARKTPDLDAFLFWATAEGWPDAPSDEMDADEAPFYLEGLLDQDLRLAWVLLAAADAPGTPDHLRLYVGDTTPPAPPAGWIVLAAAQT